MVAADLRELLFAATRRALHLELRDTYERTERFLAWRAKKPFDRTQLAAGWRELLAPLVACGGDVRRLRVVSEPVSEYVRYEYEVTPENLAAGEKVRWLPRRRASDLRFPGNDFWLVDDRLLFNISGGDGEYLGVEENNDHEVIDFCMASFEAAWSRAVDHSDYRP